MHNLNHLLPRIKPLLAITNQWDLSEDYVLIMLEMMKSNPDMQPHDVIDRAYAVVSVELHERAQAWEDHVNGERLIAKLQDDDLPF